MLRTFLRDTKANFAIATAVAVVPLMGALAIGVDFTEMNRHHQDTLNALDAAGIATARRIVQGGTDADIIAYAKDFFEANLNAVDPANTVLTVTLPKNNTGGGTLKLQAQLKYHPYFFPAATYLVNQVSGSETINFDEQIEVRLKNTLEVALALDNSGSMDETGSGSGKKRIELLKAAAKQLVDTLAGQAGLVKQVAEPVRFSLVPFAASVNVGPQHADSDWMDKSGISPVHHENFDWTTINSTNKYTELSGGVRYARGSDWGPLRDKPLTRFTLYNEMKRNLGWTSNMQYVCVSRRSNGTCRTWEWQDHGAYTYGPFASWQGCVEVRPYPYNNNDAAPSSGTPATMFVPMFGPDETDLTDGNSRPANNNWWVDGLTGTGNSAARQMNMAKYFVPAPLDGSGNPKPAMGMNQGPNASCSTKPITPLLDVTVQAGLDAVKAAIDEMTPSGATNAPEGLAWGWRTVSSGAPFTEGRPDTERGNDKVVILLTDGANTYYTPGSVTAFNYSGTYWNYGGNDLAGNKAIYSAFGYTGKAYNGGHTRLFLNTSNSVGKTDYSNANYTRAMNEQFAMLCANAKAANVILMTVALDLDASNATEKKQIEALTACASESRFRKNPDGSGAKLFYNATGSSLADKFKEIADELSNLRIVS